jgi:hypothetical protein
VIALVATTLAFTTVQADRLAHRTINQGLSDTRGVWETFQADRYAKLKLGIRVLGNDPYYKAAVETNDQATILDTLKERNLELKAAFFIATDPAGIVIARDDRPGAQGEDLERPSGHGLDGRRGVGTIWRQGGQALPRGFGAHADRPDPRASHRRLRYRRERGQLHPWIGQMRSRIHPGPGRPPRLRSRPWDLRSPRRQRCRVRA